jgi:putative tryptophan/tyrosine transport system substrate-binding protein
MKRREFLKSLGNAAARSLAAVFVTEALPIATWSQAAEKIRRVGALFGGVSSDPATRPVLQALVDGLREHGWEEGRNVVLEVRYAGPDPVRFAELAAELGALKVDVIMVSNVEALDAARRKAAKIPIVMAGAGGSVGLGFIESLARPGGNITGVVNQLETIIEKHLELFKEITPGIERVGIIYSPANIASLASFKEQKEKMAPRLGLVAVPIPISKPADLDEAFATIVHERVQALHVHPVPVISAQRGRIAAFAIERRLPTISGSNILARDGLLMSYGSDPRVSWRRAASYVDRILKGANPAELPVEQLDRFQLIINMKTARAMGLDLPPALVARADELIE